MTTTYPGDQSAAGHDVMFEQLHRGLSAMQAFQQLYDADLWMIKKPEFSKFRHITHHLQMITGQLSGFCESWEHQIYSGKIDADALEIASIRESLAPHLADMLIFAAQLANLAQLDLNTTLLDRSSSNAQRFAPGSSFDALVAGVTTSVNPRGT